MKNEKYNEDGFRKLVNESDNLTDIARKLGLNPHCGNRNTIKKYINMYNINTSHFRIDYSKRILVNKMSLENILTSKSTYNRTHLKKRLFDCGLKKPICEICGQDENWRDKHMSMILDHINGINDDNRIENLRIVCPNCNATLPTHCGKNMNVNYKTCKKKTYCPLSDDKKIVSIKNRSIKLRKANRPEFKQLVSDVSLFGYSATGRKYNVSDNTIRKWIKFYEKYIIPS